MNNAFPSSPIAQPSEGQKMEMLKTGTTTIGIVIKDGVILATESQATAGFYVATKKAQKLFKINDLVGMTIAGGVADAQYLVGQAQAISRLLKIQKGRIPDVGYVANIVRNMLFNGRSFFYSWNIIGGIDKNGVGKVFPIDFLGYMADQEDFCSLGSGSNFALGVLEGNWRPEMTKEDGIELATQALNAARARDAGSGYKSQIVAIMKDTGFEPIEGPLLAE